MDCKKNQKREERAITLITLVITIIVLLILAGVTIATLTGENGILTQAMESSKKSEIAEVGEQGRLDVMAWQATKLEKGEDASLTDELVKQILTGKDYVGTLGDTSFTTKKNGYEIHYADLYNERINLPNTSETTPYLPDDTSKIVDNSTLDTGLVVKDKNNNEWVWVEVPKSITVSKTTDVEIEAALQAYASDYGKSGFTDTWYEGCGLTQIEYNTNKSKMLQSIKNNGGFWIGRYETGADTIRKSAVDTLSTPLNQQDKYPYNWVTCSQAQGLANQLNSNNAKNTSSLMYGIQWDLVLKHIEKEAKKQEELKTDSTAWGNYNNATFDISKGKYSTDFGQTYIDATTIYTKSIDTKILLSTGINERNKVLNIYDLAGNEWEWVLEKSVNTSNPCTVRGGSLYDNGFEGPSVCRYSYNISRSGGTISFRPTLY